MLELTRTHLTEDKVVTKTKLKKRISAREFFKDVIEQKTEQGVLLTGLRLREDLTQAQLGKMIGVSQTNICAMENGRRPISKKVAQKLSAIFKVNYQRFL